MGFSRKCENLKVGASVGAATVGPKTWPGTTAWVSVPVPCKHARAVIFRLKSTDSNAPAGNQFNASNDPSAVLTVVATSNGYVQRGAATGRMDMVNGNTLICLPQDANGVFFHDFIQLQVTSHASGHTAAQWDVEVVYHQDALDTAQGAGQRETVPLGCTWS